jgi:hypothetical protein
VVDGNRAGRRLIRDGRLSGEEFVAFYGCYGVPEDVAQQAFGRLDTAGSGSFAIEDLMKLGREFYGNDPDAPGNWLVGPY